MGECLGIRTPNLDTGTNPDGIRLLFPLVPVCGLPQVDGAESARTTALLLYGHLPPRSEDFATPEGFAGVSMMTDLASKTTPL